MINAKHNLETRETIDYLRFIPPTLHKEATDFIAYVSSRPFEKPTCCPRCGSGSFYIQSRRELIHYHCRNCRVSFSSVTGTPFSHFLSHHDWEDIAISMLAGVYDINARRKLGSKGKLRVRTSALETVLNNSFPALYQWWLLFRYQVSEPLVEMPPQVRAQCNEFQIWLDNLVNPKVVICPKCQSQKCTIQSQVNRAGYMCKGCWRSFSLLTPTHFKKFNHVSELPEIFNLLISGTCSSEIMVKRDKKNNKVSIWRDKFMAQLRDLNLDLLADWIEWKNFCRYRQLISGRTQSNK